MKSYTTGEVAKICGFKNARVVAKLCDEDKMDCFMKESTYCRRTTRRIPQKALFSFMKKNNISFDDFPIEEIEDKATKIAVALLQNRTDVLLKVG